MACFRPVIVVQLKRANDFVVVRVTEAQAAACLPQRVCDWTLNHPIRIAIIGCFGADKIEQHCNQYTAILERRTQISSPATRLQRIQCPTIASSASHIPLQRNIRSIIHLRHSAMPQPIRRQRRLACRIRHRKVCRVVALIPSSIVIILKQIILLRIQNILVRRRALSDLIHRHTNALPVSKKTIVRTL